MTKKAVVLFIAICIAALIAAALLTEALAISGPMM